MPHAIISMLVAALSFFSIMAAPVFSAGTSDGSSAAAPDTSAYDEAKAAVDSGNYGAALPMLAKLTQNDPQNADAWNLLGFTSRMLGQLDDSSNAYLKVLAINPNHLGALEYQGELFITTGKLDLAKANLAKLKGLCGNCEQVDDLEKALKVAGA
ncbi:MAG: tetratricopeptide repeat protein [Paracoccaceae bacterium]